MNSAYLFLRKKVKICKPEMYVDSNTKIYLM